MMRVEQQPAFSALCEIVVSDLHRSIRCVLFIVSVYGEGSFTTKLNVVRLLGRRHLASVMSSEVAQNDLKDQDGYGGL